MVPARRKYPDELRDRAMRLVCDLVDQDRKVILVERSLGRRSRRSRLSYAPAEDLLAFADLPVSHGTKIWSTDPDVVEVLSTRSRCSASPAAVLVEAHDEWPFSDRRSLSERSMALPDPLPTAGR